MYIDFLRLDPFFQRKWPGIRTFASGSPFPIARHCATSHQQWLDFSPRMSLGKGPEFRISPPSLVTISLAHKPKRAHHRRDLAMRRGWKVLKKSWSPNESLQAVVLRIDRLYVFLFLFFKPVYIPQSLCHIDKVPFV